MNQVLDETQEGFVATFNTNPSAASTLPTDCVEMLRQLQVLSEDDASTLTAVKTL